LTPGIDDTPVDLAGLGEGLKRLLCYLAASARGLLTEPAEYGPLRLMEAASRLIETMQVAGMSDPALEKAFHHIERSKEQLLSGAAGFGESVDAVLDAILESE